MSFDQTETDAERGEPIELYEFVFGPGETNVYRYTNSDKNKVYGPPGGEAHTYISVPISRASYKSNGKTDNANMDIRFPLSVELSQLFLSYPPTQPVAVTVRAGHANDTEFLVVWLGLVLSSSREGDESVLTCSSTIVSTKRPGLKQNWQYGCPYVLYGEDCKADIISATSTAKVVDVQPNSLTLEAGWQGEFEYADFAGGMLRWTTSFGTEFRTILDVAEDGSITFVGVLRGVEVGQIISLIRGCDHLMTGCNKHNNINNFGGDAWIPLKNPVKYHPFW